jgi:hypothetical protein
MIYICEKKQHVAHFFSNDFTQLNFCDMLRTAKCLSSGTVFKQVNCKRMVWTGNSEIKRWICADALNDRQLSYKHSDYGLFIYSLLEYNYSKSPHLYYSLSAEFGIYYFVFALRIRVLNIMSF